MIKHSQLFYNDKQYLNENFTEQKQSKLKAKTAVKMSGKWFQKISFIQLYL